VLSPGIQIGFYKFFPYVNDFDGLQGISIKKIQKTINYNP